MLSSIEYVEDELVLVLKLVFEVSVSYVEVPFPAMGFRRPIGCGINAITKSEMISKLYSK